MVEQEKIHQKIQEILDKCDKGKYIFRGEERCYKEVSSNLYRHYNKLLKNKNNNTDNKSHLPVLKFEETIVDRARRHFGLKTPNIEILTELQHHGGKTNLIDFTENIHVALFFACNGSFKEDGRIILFNTSGITENPDIDIDYNNANDYTIVTPVSKDPRVIFQSSVFVHAPRGYIERYLGKKSERYQAITIEAELKEQFLDYLRKYCGIETETIYNDIQGFIQNQNNYHAAEKKFYLGIENYVAKQVDEAIKYYNKAIELNPQFAEAFYNRGLAKADLGKPEEAIKDYDRAIKLNPLYSKAYNNRGTAKADLGKPEEAIKDYDRAIKLNPKNPNAYSNRGLTKTALGTPQEAVKDYDKAIELNPKYAEAYNHRGHAKFSLGKLEEAIKDYNEALKLNPKLAAAFIKRAIAKIALRRKKKQ